ncbi:cryptic plasmid protein A [Paraburkholderia tagetis]|uniref:Cryptic plasmid protein A n=1 Tax=Paraburkholderia tagetis TaxID=2913261 RepID=A0A9X1RUV2_9BURK|nr:cryptic plasmid protein A [Paraburkholderia tagetis]MCG5075364.1 cryptic plasmid protein A [Paraburkholderia tagetis]
MDASSTVDTDVILANDRDRRVYDYLIATCGESKVANARQQLPGRTRPYVSNIAKMLGVTIPDAVVITPRAEGNVPLAVEGWDGGCGIG